LSILQNAIDSIALGIEDYNSSDSRRLASCALNIFAGILLLFKHKLAEISPPGTDEGLIKQQVIAIISPSAGLQWRGKGSKTVNVQQIRERFDSLDIAVDWKRIDGINKYRNDIEHYYSTKSQNAAKILIADSFIVDRDFVRIHLGKDPLALFGQDTWNTMTSVAEVYEKEKKECIQHIETVDWEYQALEDSLIEFRCSACGSGLIDVVNTGTDRWNTNFKCRSCSETWDFEKIAEKALDEYYSNKNFSALKEGADPVTITCPFCLRDAYLLEEDVCVLCDETAERTCKRCGSYIPYEEIDGEGYCGWCAHMMSKDD